MKTEPGSGICLDPIQVSRNHVPDRLDRTGTSIDDPLPGSQRTRWSRT
jgi:hypothetical protein